MTNWKLTISCAAVSWLLIFFAAAAGSFVVDRRRLWPAGRVYYKFNQTITEERRTLMRQQMNFLSGNLSTGCISFIEVPANDNSIDYVHITDKKEKFKRATCVSSIGRRSSKNKNYMKLTSEECWRDYGYNILHGLIHILGATEEQNRHDRGLFLYVDRSAILDDAKNRFRMREQYTETANTTFDFCSIMLNNPKTGQKGSKPTYTLNSPFNTSTYQDCVDNDVARLSDTDIYELSQMYNCSVNPDILEGHLKYSLDITNKSIQAIEDCGTDKDCKTWPYLGLAEIYLEGINGTIKNTDQFQHLEKNVSVLYDRIVDLNTTFMVIDGDRSKLIRRYQVPEVGECDKDADCSWRRRCIDTKCKMLTEEELVKICFDCGKIAHTECLFGPNSVPFCTCKPGYRGNASVSCEGLSNENERICSLCGTNAECRFDKNTFKVSCHCLQGYFGDPLDSCIECVIDSHCPLNRSCIKGSCIDTCTFISCGDGYTCEVNNHKAACKCPDGLSGNPYINACCYDE